MGIQLGAGTNVSDRDTNKRARKFRGIAARHVLAAVKAFVSIGALVYLGMTVDRKAIWEALNSVHSGYLLLAVMQMLLIAVLGGARWQLVLRALKSDMSLWPLTRVFWIGMAFNQVLPSAVGGDALRIMLVHRSGLDLMRSAVSVLIERGLMMLSLVLIVALAAWYAPSHTLDPRLIAFAVVLLLVGVAGLAALPAMEWLLNRLPKDLRLVRFIVYVVKALRSVVLGSAATSLVLLCLLTNINLGLAAWWLSVGFGLPLTVLQVLAVISMVSLAMVIPVSIGGWGVREAAMVAILAPLAVPGGVAFLFSVTFGLAIAASSLPGLFLLWWRPRSGEIELALVKAVD